jgi:hypothetical protein
MGRWTVWLVVVLSAWSCGSSRSKSKKDVVGGGGSEVQSSTEPDVPAPLGPPQTAVGCLREQVCAGVQGGREDCEPGERCNTTLAVPKCQKLYCADVGESCDPSVGDSLCEKGLGCTSSGQCRAPECGGRECGQDPNGLACGTCVEGKSCSADGRCVCANPRHAGDACDRCATYEELWAAYDGPAASVVLDKREVLTSEYRACMTAGVCSTPTMPAYMNPEGLKGFCTIEQHPGIVVREHISVNCVTQFQAEGYCSWVGKRLPTALEFMWFATEGKMREWKWKDYEVGERQLQDGTCPAGCCIPCFAPEGISSTGHCELMSQRIEWTSTMELSTNYPSCSSERGVTLYQSNNPWSGPWSHHPTSSGVGFRCIRD